MERAAPTLPAHMRLPRSAPAALFALFLLGLALWVTCAPPMDDPLRSDFRFLRPVLNADAVVVCAPDLWRAENVGDDLGRPADDAVAAGVSEPVVDGLEIVDIQHDRAEGRGAAPDLLVETKQLLLIGVRIADAGQRIGIRLRVHIAQIALELLLGGVDLRAQRLHLVA